MFMFISITKYNDLYELQLMHMLIHVHPQGWIWTFEKGGAQPDLSFDVELAGICTVIVCKAHGHAKHANTRGVWGHAPPRKF